MNKIAPLVIIALLLVVAPTMAWPDRGQLRVAGGSAVIPEGTVVELHASKPPPSLKFQRWVGDTQNVADVTAAQTTLLMPATAVAVRATFTRIAQDEEAHTPAATPPRPASVQASRETHSSTRDVDDPCIWVHPEDPARSLIIGTDKEAGRLRAFDLFGNQVWRVRGDRPNNIDVRGDLIAVSDKDAGKIRLYRMQGDGRKAPEKLGSFRPGMREPYGLALYRSPTSGEMHVLVSGRRAGVRQFRLNAERTEGTLVRTLPLSLVEGMAADDETGRLFIAEEAGVLWAYGAEPGEGQKRTMIDSRASRRFSDDLEGVAIYHGKDGAGYVIVSSQGTSCFVVYDRAPPYAFHGSFQVTRQGAEIDGVSDTDGIEVLGLPLGDAFPHGIFVCHDGHDSGHRGNNFKLVPWENIADSLGLVKESTYDPRVEPLQEPVGR